MSVVFSLVILTIFSRVCFYSWSYMERDKEKGVFYVVLYLFVVSIIFLTFAFNFTSLLLGWDGLGVTSFCLIKFFHNLKRIKASVATLMINRLGDSIIIIYLGLGINSMSWNSNIFGVDNRLSPIPILIAARTKRAQFPFSAWLPLAIAAPTPVSSLVHSSTLVTAGAYLLMRSKIMWFSEFKLVLVLLRVSIITTVLGRTLALTSIDLKEIIAYSTLSQIGLVVFSICLLNVELSLFHLLTHALFKAVLFIRGGLLIHIYSTQDVRVINLNNCSVLVKSSLFISSLSLVGTPFLSGFYSKDLIIDVLFYSVFSSIITKIGLIRVLLSSAYIFRLLKIINLNIDNKESLKNANFIVVALKATTPFSIFFGSLYIWLIRPLVFCLNRTVVKLIVVLFLILGIITINFNLTINLLFLMKCLNVRVILIKEVYLFYLIEKGWILKISSLIDYNKRSYFIRNFSLKYILILFLFTSLIIINCKSLI